MQGSFEVTPEGLLMAVTNEMFSINDSTGAILRRQRAFPANIIHKERKPLLSYFKDAWVGSLVDELPGILNWAVTMEEKKAYNYLVKMKENVPSLIEFEIEQQMRVNHLIIWVREELVFKGSAYIGYPIKDDLKMTGNKDTLYSAYYHWCLTAGVLPLKHIKFTDSLMKTLLSLNVSCKKKDVVKVYYLMGFP